MHDVSARQSDYEVACLIGLDAYGTFIFSVSQWVLRWSSSEGLVSLVHGRLAVGVELVLRGAPQSCDVAVGVYPACVSE